MFFATSQLAITAFTASGYSTISMCPLAIVTSVRSVHSSRIGSTSRFGRLYSAENRYTA